MQKPLEPPDLSQARLCVIRNRGSGKEDDRIIGQITDGLKPFVREFTLWQTDDGSSLPELARQAVDDGFDIIVAAGGDGTQSAVAGVLAGSDAIMGVLPGGTFNYFARDLGVGETMEEAIETLRSGVPRRADVAKIENLVFLNNVSLGIYPHILKTRESVYRRWGRSRLAAYWSVLIALRRLRHPMRLTARVDGQSQTFSTALAFVARNAFQLESFGLEGADQVRAGHFAVLIARARKPVPLLRSAFRLAIGLSAQDSDFDLIVTDELSIETRKSQQLVAHDGEKTRLASPFHLKVWPDALTVLVPSGAARGDGD
ncbi:diacylglycerol/lipid kinase family protein [Paracoccus fistulariae]|uniref:NAD(+)/NADH kinase n=1 Tax=Paracoccus fistulariae TaxID=658446 RepID=A0ABY7SN98_9RHOB|nr:diacylglycerol kinase family protein [Paracoccus fistulariae]MDB6179859.1 diacylglycerol kinase family protein [Paracoccus fistulariae]WCR07962.1 NAD(+)/NADH kinase [Paracoccus fistulariae]